MIRRARDRVRATRKATTCSRRPRGSPKSMSMRAAKAAAIELGFRCCAPKTQLVHRRRQDAEVPGALVKRNPPGEEQPERHHDRCIHRRSNRKGGESRTSRAVVHASHKPKLKRARRPGRRVARRTPSHEQCRISVLARCERLYDRRGHPRHRQREHQRASQREPRKHLPPRVANLIIGGAQERDQKEHQHVASHHADHEGRLGEPIVQRVHQLGGTNAPCIAIARVAIERAPERRSP